MRTRVQRTVSRCFAALRQLRQIRRRVPSATLQMLVVALVHSRLDYGNGVLVGLQAYLTRRLHSVLNTTARLIYRLMTCDHISDALISLHWLRVRDEVTTSWLFFGVQGSAWRCTTLARSADLCRRLAWSTNTPFYQC